MVAFAQIVNGRAEDELAGIGRAFLYLRINGPGLDERTAGRCYEVAARVVAPGPQFRYLADAAADRVLMTLGAGLRVINRPEAIGYLILVFKGLPISIESGLVLKIIGHIIEAGRGIITGLAMDDARDDHRQDKRRQEKCGD